jgi:hypothetical protein
MFRNIVLRIIKISTRSVLYLMFVFYLAVVVMELYFVSNVAYSPDHKLPPKVLTDTIIICRMVTISSEIINSTAIPTTCMIPKN